MHTGRPAPTEHSPQSARYVALVPEEDIVRALEEQRDVTHKLLADLDEKRADYRYATGKWSVKEVVGHITDAERVFAYRIMAISRGEKQSLPGFDENDYVRNGDFDSVTLYELADALVAARNATLALLRTLPAEAWVRTGVANKVEVTVRAIAYIAAGHERHHVNILKERYGV